MSNQSKSHNPKWIAIISSVFTGLLLSVFSAIFSLRAAAEIFEQTGKEILPPIFLITITVFIALLVGKLTFNWFLQRRKITGIIMFLVLGLLSLSLTVFIGCVSLIDIATSDMCAETVISEIASPNKKLKAVIFQIDCGATTGFNSHVVIMASNSSLSKESQSQGLFGAPRSLFAADTNHSRAPAGKGGGPEVRLSWISDTKLEIQYHKFARVIRSNLLSKGVDISYQTFN